MKFIIIDERRMPCFRSGLKWFLVGMDVLQRSPYPLLYFFLFFWFLMRKTKCASYGLSFAVSNKTVYIKMNDWPRSHSYVFECRYWNSRLATERQRLLESFTRNDVVCMCSSWAHYIYVYSYLYAVSLKHKENIRKMLDLRDPCSDNTLIIT